MGGIVTPRGLVSAASAASIGRLSRCCSAPNASPGLYGYPSCALEWGNSAKNTSDDRLSCRSGAIGLASPPSTPTWHPGSFSCMQELTTSRN